MVKRALESSSGAVRAKATEFAISLYEIVGDMRQMVSYLTDMKQPAIRDSLLAAFESIRLDVSLLTRCCQLRGRRRLATVAACRRGPPGIVGRIIFDFKALG